MGKYREDQREMHCVLEDLEKNMAGYVEKRYCTVSESQVVEIYTKVVKALPDGMTVCLKVKVGQQQGSALSTFLFTTLMGRLMDEIQKSPTDLDVCRGCGDLLRDSGQR